MWIDAPTQGRRVICKRHARKASCFSGAFTSGRKREFYVRFVFVARDSTPAVVVVVVVVVVTNKKQASKQETERATRCSRI